MTGFRRSSKLENIEHLFARRLGSGRADGLMWWSPRVAPTDDLFLEGKQTASDLGGVTRDRWQPGRGRLDEAESDAGAAAAAGKKGLQQGRPFGVRAGHSADSPKLGRVADPIAPVRPSMADVFDARRYVGEVIGRPVGPHEWAMHRRVPLYRVSIARDPSPLGGV